MKRLICTILVILCALSLCSCESMQLGDSTNLTEGAIENPSLQAHFIDVGQGDCILLESQGEYAIIDAGEYDQAATVTNYLEAHKVDSLKYVISTHPHSDHCGGLGEIIKEFSCETFICPDVQSDSVVWEYVLDMVDEKQLFFVNPKVGDKFTLGSSTITILSPSEDSVYSSMNDYSLVCKVVFEDTSILLTGDAEKVVEKELLRSGADLEADVLKCGHHGSSTSNTKAFLEAVDPNVAIITCGRDNDYGHPHKETLSALSACSIPYWRTDEVGTIIVSSDGEDISIGIDQTTYQVTDNPTPTAHNTSESYVGNKNSKVFHKSSCSSVANTKEKNKVYFEDRQSAVDSEYKPCKACNP